MAVRMERRAIGMELKESYYNQAVKNIEAALRKEINEDVSEDIEEEGDVIEDEFSEDDAAEAGIVSGREFDVSDRDE